MREIKPTIFLFHKNYIDIKSREWEVGREGEGEKLDEGRGEEREAA